MKTNNDTSWFSKFFYFLIANAKLGVLILYGCCESRPPNIQSASVGARTWRRLTVIILRGTFGPRDVILPVHFSAHGRDQTGQNVKLEQNTNGHKSEIILILFK